MWRLNATSNLTAASHQILSSPSLSAPAIISVKQIPLAAAFPRVWTLTDDQQLVYLDYA